MLPKEVAWSYLEQEEEEKLWSFQGQEVNGKKQGYYFKNLRVFKENESEDNLSDVSWKPGGEKVLVWFFTA